MSEILISTFISITAFFIFLTVHIILWRTLPSSKRELPLLVLIAALSYIAMALFQNEIELLSVSLYLLLIMLYLHLYVGIERSVSIRILGELAQSKEGTMKIDEIQSRYSPTAMFEHRLKSLVVHGFLVEDAGVYRSTKKGDLLAKLTLMLERWYNLQSTG